MPGWAAGNSDKRRARLDGPGAGGSDEQMDEVEGEGGGKEAVRSAPSLEETLSSTTNRARKVPRKLRPERLTVVRLADGNRIGGSLVYLPFSSFRHQAISKLPANDINPPLPPSPPPSPLLRPRLNPPAALHKRYRKSPRCIPAPTQHPHLSSSFPPLRHKHNRRRQGKILPYLEPLNRHHPKSNLNIRPRRGAKVNGDLPHLPRQNSWLSLRVVDSSTS